MIYLGVELFIWYDMQFVGANAADSVVTDAKNLVDAIDQVGNR